MKNERNKIKEKPKKKHKILRTILRVIIIIIILIVLFAGGFVGYSVYKNGWGLKSLLQTAVGTSEEEMQNLGEFKVLILGVSEDISVALTDTIMVAGGAEETLKRVNDLTGLNIEYYVVISNNALVELVDEIGGVQFDVPMDMNYDSANQDLHIHLKAGEQKLNGEQAEGLVRFRKNNNGTSYSHEYGSDDYGRMKTQRDFIKAVAEQTLKAKNITKVGNLIDIVKENVTTNITDWNTVKKYIPSAVDFNMDNLETAAVPGESARIPAKTGLWFFLADEVQTKQLVTELFAEENGESQNNTNTNLNNVANQNTVEKNKTTNNSTSTTTSNINIEVLNGSGDSKSLTEVTKLLKSKGYTVYKTGTTTSTSKTTIINKSGIADDTISDVKKALGKGIISSSSSNANKADITIIIGKDY